MVFQKLLLPLLLPLLAFCAATPSECGPNEIFKSCGSACEPSCSNPDASNQPCPQVCIPNKYQCLNCPRISGMDKIVTLKSLKELAILKSAEAFQKSQIQIPAGKLTNEENNELFEQIPAHFSAENSDRMIENFNLTRLILNSRDLKPDLLKISHSMNLEDFELNLKKEVTPFGGVTKFDLPTALLQCLNPETRQKLRTLKIEASTHRFVRGWAQQLCQLVPNLQSLSIHDFPIAKYEFRTICSSLKFLTTLEISRMEIPTLNGISKLQNLKNLIMNSINCLNFEDLFNLRNLEYLDLSALRLTSFRGVRDKSFKCPEESLPLLKVLDITRCGDWVKQEDLNTFVETHPKLHTIGSLYNKRLFAPNKIEDRKIVFLTCVNLEKSLDSLKYYMSFSKADVVSELLNIILKFLRNNYDEQSKNTIQKCFTIMIDGLLRKHSGTKENPLEDSRRQIVDCLFEILRSDRSKMFSTEQKRELLKTLMYDEIARCLEFLQLEDILLNSMDHMEQICNHSARLIAKFKGNIDKGWLKLILRSAEKLGDDGLRRMCRTHPGFRKSIMLHVHGEHPSYYEEYYWWSLSDSSEIRLLESIEMAGILTRLIYNHQREVNAFIHVLTNRAKFEFRRPELRRAILRELRTTVIDMGHSFEYIFSEKIFSTWLSMFHSDDDLDLSRQAVEVYVTFMFHETYVPGYGSGGEIQRIVDEIRLSIDNLVGADGKIDDIVSRLIEEPQVPQKAKQWAIWIKTHRDMAEDVVEPGKKKRKLTN
ncbi:hypothetical protein L3Y34_000452 [Caenorhabditis briggsae]|uniref:Uncharacterized protein n=1 Tax=Caenorhabditis briggsae TaxID=6238 RepID=A0AAE9D9L9_CAEBR|nr:hypothetical protein L3Y34_000452 [Caenorhabditis briggsae]